VTKMDKMDNQELISALADGQLQGEAFARGVQAATADARARETWFAYHVVGEVLRTGRPGTGTAPEAFLARMRERLQQESPAAPAVTAPSEVSQSAPAANDRLWKLAAGLASVAAVAAVGWNVWSGSAAGVQPQLAVAPQTASPVEATPATMARDPRLDQFLAAHRQLGGATVLQNSGGFLRNATFEAPGR
jgi:sigma-E factor negative regulatory protein RseA